MRMKKFPLEVGVEYLVMATHEETKEELRIVATWWGYGFESLSDSNDDDYLKDHIINEYNKL